jgi:hypothetical protein
VEFMNVKRHLLAGIIMILLTSALVRPAECG